MTKEERLKEAESWHRDGLELANEAGYVNSLNVFRLSDSHKWLLAELKASWERERVMRECLSNIGKHIHWKGATFTIRTEPNINDSTLGYYLKEAEALASVEEMGK